MRNKTKKIFISLFTIVFILLLTITLSRFVHGHGEEQLGSSEEKKTTPTSSNSTGIELSEIAQKSIGLKVVKADIRPIEEVLLINGIVKPEPNRVAEVTARAEGRVQELYVNLGDRVKKGQKLAAMLPRQIGNPPPLVSITAPLSGIVVERNISLHSTVEPNRTFFGL
jgi:multidrug efflux pump subunit AcrA (membrane-fusion protein)